MSERPKSYWRHLQELRANFLTEDPVKHDYWSDREKILAYDETFGQRISWKWHAVRDELAMLDWRPAPDSTLIDWGCGPGAATRSLLSDSNWADRVGQLYLYDRSSAAAQYAQQKLADVRHWRGSVQIGLPSTPSANCGVILSHALTELPPKQVESLMRLTLQCDFLLAVEPGTKQSATKLSVLRDRLLAAGWMPLAPCTHANLCPALSSNTKHWCHSFATPPQEVFHSAFWRRFSSELKVDLRSLPYSYLLMVKHPRKITHPAPSRILGRPRLQKNHALALACDKTGLTDRRVIKRMNPQEFSDLSDGAKWL